MTTVTMTEPTPVRPARALTGLPRALRCALVSIALTVGPTGCGSDVPTASRSQPTPSPAKGGATDGSPAAPSATGSDAAPGLSAKDAEAAPTADAGAADPDVDGDGFSVGAGDCDDSEPTVYPGAKDPCADGIDQDCSGGDSTCGPVTQWTLLPQGPKHVTALWAFGPTQVLAGGLYSTMRRFDGTQWSTENAKVGSVRKLWASGPNDIYAVGPSGGSRYDGSQWSRISLPAGHTNTWSIWGHSPSDVVLWRHDSAVHWFSGSNWTQHQLGPVVFGIHGTGTAFYLVGMRFHRFANGTLTPLPRPTVYKSRAVWAFGPNRVVVAGQNKSGDRSQIAVFDGKGFAFMAGGDLEFGAFSAVTSLWGRAPDDLYATVSEMKQHGDTPLFNKPGRLLYFDGNSWRTISNFPEGCPVVTGVGPHVFVGCGDGVRYGLAH